MLSGQCAKQLLQKGMKEIDVLYIISSESQKITFPTPPSIVS
jgi:hypothetical protein